MKTRENELFLYRIVSFEEFIYLAVNGKEKYTCPSAWKDKNEGLLYHYLEKEETAIELGRMLKNKIPNLTVDNLIGIYCRLWYYMWNTYVQCWSLTEESDAMWQSYSYGKHGIRICAKKSDLEAHIKSECEKLQGIGYTEDILYPVKYFNSIEKLIENQIEKIIAMKSAIAPLYSKREAFSHEKEQRIVLMDKSFEGTINMCVQSVYREIYSIGDINDDTLPLIVNAFIKNRIQFEQIKQGTDDRTDEEVKRDLEYHKCEMDSYHLFLCNPDLGYISNVLIHPEASDWYVKEVKEITEANLPGSQFEGKSQLYSPIVQ